MTPEIKSIILRVAPFLLIIIAIMIAVKKKRLLLTDLSIQKPVSFNKFYLWIGLYLIFTILTELILFKYGILEVTHRKYSLTTSIVRITGIIILAPIAEELAFRGIFLFKLTQWNINKHLAIVIQALVFVLLHSFAYQNTLSSNIGIAQVFIDAVLFAYAKYNTKSIYTPIAMHVSNNLIAVIEQIIL